MKLAIPGMMAAALLVASPVFAQNTMSSGSTSAPGASVAKDDQTYKPARSKKHMASHTRHHKAMKSRAQTTGSGSSSAPGASINKDDSIPKSK